MQMNAQSLVVAGAGNTGSHVLSELARLNRPLARCPACGRRMVSAGFDSLESLDAASASEFSELTLTQIGLRAGDIISSGKNQHWLMEAA